MSRITIRLALMVTTAVICGRHLTAVAHAQSGALTPFGAEQAASADGAIPAYTGGIASMTGLPEGGPNLGYPDPFAGERPLFSVSSQNMAQYQSQLTPGTQALLKRYPSFHLDVYPTHRTMSYPSWVLQNTQKNATTAQMVGQGEGVTGAYSGIPFPVPKDGYQVMWNSFLNYMPAYCHELYGDLLVDAGGSVTDLGDIEAWWVSPYYNPNATALRNNVYRIYKVEYHTPPAEAGNIDQFMYPVNFQVNDDVTYIYQPGVRRVRVAPEFKFDTPIAQYGGAVNFDEIDLFYGSMQKFNFRLVGKKEIIIPYNDYKLSHTTPAALLGQHTLNPTGIRWERHRVWEVEATLKPGERHVYSRWDFYLDEDSWNIDATESYDHAGAIYRVGFQYPYQNYSQTKAIRMTQPFGIYDLSKGNYSIARLHRDNTNQLDCKATLPNMSEYSPQMLAGGAIR